MTYWEKRILEDEEYAQSIAEAYNLRQKQMYIRAYKNIESQLNALYAEIQASGAENITRSQLWQYSKYQELLAQIEKEAKGIGIAQDKMITEACNKVFEETIGKTIDSFGGFSQLAQPQIKDVLNTKWSGKSYSQRVWNNTNLLADRLQTHIEDMIVLGKNPTQVKAALKNEFNISYNQADRLVRTEASYVYNEAAKEGYREAGVQTIEFLAESDCCDQCDEYSGKEFPIDAVPQLPIHPNCRCCYVPIVQTTF